jgi:hypothetical protein
MVPTIEHPTTKVCFDITHHFQQANKGAANMGIKTSLMAAACALLILSGCGGGDDNGPRRYTTQILSDSRFDGDIEETGTNSYVVTQGMSQNVQSVLAGIDP